MEDYSSRGNDVAAVRFAATRRSLPPGVPRGHVYRFDSDLADMADAGAQAEAAAEEW